MAKKDPGRALLQFRNALQVKPTDPEVTFRIAQATLALGDYRQGVAALRATLALNPKHSAAQVALAGLMVASNDKELLSTARTDLQNLLADGGSNPNALQVLALSELKLGDPAEAANHLELAIASAPQDLLIAATLAQAKIGQNDISGAENVLKNAVASSPKSTDAALMLARFYMGARKYAEAEAQYRRALSLDPKNVQSLLGLAVLENGTGKKTEAEQTVRELSALPDADAKSMLGLFLFENGRRDEALKEFESLAKAYPENRSVRTRLVAAYQSTNRSADAMKVLDAALVKHPKDSDALVQRAELLVASGKYDRAEADLNEVLRLQATSPEVHYTVARLDLARGAQSRYREELTKTIELSPFFEPARRDLARALISIDQPKAALDLLNRAPESQRNDVALLVQRNWAYWGLKDMANMRKGVDQGLAVQRSSEFLVQDGIWKQKSGNSAGARASFDEALKLNPSDMRALTALRDSYLEQKQLPAAIAKVKEIVAAHPKAGKAQEFLGTMLLETGNFKDARVALEAARAMEPDNYKVDLYLTQADVAEGKWSAARTRLEGVLAHREDGTARLWLGNVEQGTGNHAAALEQYRKAVAASPNDTQALNNLAYLLLTQGKDPDQALKYAQQAVEASPDNLDSKDTLGWILYQKGSYTMAIKHLEVAASKRNVVAEYHLAMAYAKSGDKNRARTVFDAAYKQNPRLPEAQQAQDLVR